jgi:hypothetical protein
VAIAGSVWFRRNLLQVPRGCRGVEAGSIGKKLRSAAIKISVLPRSKIGVVE